MITRLGNMILLYNITQCDEKSQMLGHTTVFGSRTPTGESKNKRSKRKEVRQRKFTETCNVMKNVATYT